MSEPVQYFVRGKNAWRTGVRGLLLRKRSLGSAVVLALLTMGAPWWWTAWISPLPKEVKLATVYAVPALGLLVGTAVILVLHSLRRSSMRRVEVGRHLHELAHYLRESQIRVFSGRACGKPNHFAKGSDGLHAFAEGVCERVKDLFHVLTADHTVDVAIRLASTSDGGDSTNSRVVYATVGRSSGLSSDRRFTTQALPANTGVARFLAEEHGSRGVLYYSDIPGAARVHAYDMTPNDSTYSDEIKTMMVAPLTAWDGQQRAMIGILYVTSRGKTTFREEYVDYVRFAADTVALALSDVVESMQPAVEHG